MEKPFRAKRLLARMDVFRILMLVLLTAIALASTMRSIALGGRPTMVHWSIEPAKAKRGAAICQVLMIEIAELEKSNKVMLGHVMIEDTESTLE